MIRTKLPDVEAWETTLYKSMAGLIFGRVKHASEKYGIPLDEAKDEARFIFMRSLRRYNSSQGVKFSTFLYSCLSNGLIDLAMTLKPKVNQWGGGFLHKVEPYQNDDGDFSDPVDNIADFSSELQCSFFDDVRSLPEAARLLVDMATSGLLDSEDDLRQIFVERLGWSLSKYNLAANCIRKFLAER